MKYFTTSILGALLIGWSVFPSTVEAQSAAPCGDRNKIISNLEKGYAEAPVSMGLASNGTVIEVFASETGTFTIILTQPNGLSCLLAAGENWEDLPTPAVWREDLILEDGNMYTSECVHPAERRHEKPSRLIDEAHQTADTARAEALYRQAVDHTGIISETVRRELLIMLREAPEAIA